MRGARVVMLVLAAVPAQAGPLVEACSAGLSGERYAGLDEDGDAIPDSDDWCPDTPEGARVRADGCAAWEVPHDCDAPEERANTRSR